MKPHSRCQRAWAGNIWSFMGNDLPSESSNSTEDLMRIAAVFAAHRTPSSWPSLRLWLSRHWEHAPMSFIPRRRAGNLRDLKSLTHTRFNTLICLPTKFGHPDTAEPPGGMGAPMCREGYESFLPSAAETFYELPSPCRKVLCAIDAVPLHPCEAWAPTTQHQRRPTHHF